MGTERKLNNHLIQKLTKEIRMTNIDIRHGDCLPMSVEVLN